MTDASVRVRLFLTCWIGFCAFFATDFVREHYLVLSIGDDLSYRLDAYADLHNDIFWTEDHGAHHGANPGASMLAAPAYMLFKPLIDRVSARAVAARQAHPESEPVYDDPRPARRRFFREVWRRGLDIKFGLAGAVSQAFCMAPLSAFAVVLLFNLLRYRSLSQRLSIWLSLLYAFGTPVAFRTGYLNQNLMVGHFTFAAFLYLWWPEGSPPMSERRRLILAGFFSGLGLLCDYSGAVSCAVLGLYALVKLMDRRSFLPAAVESLYFLLGVAGPLLLLFQYQYASFGHFLYPGQHYMPAVEWIDVGYQGFGGPQPDLLVLLLFEYRYGLFITAPLLLLSLAAPLVMRGPRGLVPPRETAVLWAFSLAMIVFFSAVQYTRLQYVTGLRYLMPVVPTLFLLAAGVLIRVPQWFAFPVVLVSVVVSICIAMVRYQWGVHGSVMRVFLEGFQLPWLSTLSRMAGAYAPYLGEHGVSALPILVLIGVVIYLVWAVKQPRASLVDG